MILVVRRAASWSVRDAVPMSRRIYKPSDYRKGLGSLIKHVGHHLEITDNITEIELKCVSCDEYLGWRWKKPPIELTLREYLGVLFWGKE